MRYLAREFVARSLAFFARTVIRKYRPKVVMVTGSVGKTSTKDALAAALASRFYLRASEKSYNSEFGVPFTIFGVKNPWWSFARWLIVFKEALALIFLPNHYPKLLILEVGADRPGDLSRILKIVTPDALVVTRLPDIPVHVEAYASPEAVREEEFAPAYWLLPGSPLIVNAGDQHALQMAKRLSAMLITYGEGEADVAVGDIGFYLEGGAVAGMEAKVTTAKGEGRLVVKGSVGPQQVLPAAAALTTALALGIDVKEALESLLKYVPPPGRGRLFAGINESVLIDDSYNSSPAAVEEVLKTLRDFPGAGRRVAILGDMLELGRYSVVEHTRIGELAREAADLVISVGIRARAVHGACAYNDSHAAVLELPSLIESGDVILIKGSQSVRMERIVEALLADPADRARLVRQEREWKF
ncbi:hypothetical protein A3C95_01970 [Candidatus Kaiserbacteria bacterium RIFCSPHIGHO2_02_FULL_56_30]|uniref:UDP-N-acetylmuramoyl-tripeptide--D-alanyl-D-alanine ligase n=1 Tax=Candidatus Kaiserbacteria bacterium RIFCSPHIGHO2_02_FULL_56_30 TaxID=1798499 RepID=A0A1F6E482_9BACT|nr:MAG: hypothetical protein A3C95_01970 [Candidatus Kaiserbacteria bacterium RIFCSPHIGHO2_02_FULL_56_30]